MGRWGYIFAACLAAGFSGSAAAAEKKASGTVAAHRLLVADEAEPLVRVVDMESGKVLLTAKVQSPARLWRGASDRYVFAVQNKAGKVAILDSGIRRSDHGDHGDIHLTAPSLLRAALEGERPVHLNRDASRVVAFFDGTGSATVVEESKLVAGDLSRKQTITSERPHHGVAKPVNRTLTAMSVAAADSKDLPIAIALRDANGGTSNQIPCPQLHGEGATGAFVAFGCNNGVAVYRSTEQQVEARHIPYPATLPAGRMVRNIQGAKGFRLMVADFGADGMVVFDPAAKDGDFRYIPLPARRIAFELRSDPGDTLFVHLEDGRVLAVNTLTGEVKGSVQMTGRYSMEQGVVRPRLTSAGRYLAASNPDAGEVVILSADTLAEVRRIRTGGKPFDVLAIGATGAKH
jgi:hypothetical protein